MNQSITIHQNDSGIILTFHCQDESGLPIDLTGFSVDFYLYEADTCINQDHTQCAKSDAAQGIADYTIVQGDTYSTGIFQGVLHLQDGGANVRSIHTIPIIIES